MLYGDPGIIDPGIICFALFLSVYSVVCLTTRDLLTIMQLTHVIIPCLANDLPKAST